MILCGRRLLSGRAVSLSGPRHCSQGRGRRWLLVRHFDGLPVAEDFQCVEEELPELQDGQLLVQPEFWSVDPYARVYPRAYGYTLPVTMLGSQVCPVL